MLIVFIHDIFQASILKQGIFLIFAFICETVTFACFDTIDAHRKVLVNIIQGLFRWRVHHYRG